MIGDYYDDVDRRGDGCGLGCDCPACRYDRKLFERQKELKKNTINKEKLTNPHKRDGGDEK